jgi:hypothetical protein
MGNPPADARRTLQLLTQMSAFVEYAPTTTRKEDRWHQPITAVVVAIVQIFF